MPPHGPIRARWHAHRLNLSAAGVVRRSSGPRVLPGHRIRAVSADRDGGVPGNPEAVTQHCGEQHRTWPEGQQKRKRHRFNRFRLSAALSLFGGGRYIRPEDGTGGYAGAAVPVRVSDPSSTPGTCTLAIDCRRRKKPCDTKDQIKSSAFLTTLATGIRGECLRRIDVGCAFGQPDPAFLDVGDQSVERFDVLCELIGVVFAVCGQVLT